MSEDEDTLLSWIRDWLGGYIALGSLVVLVTAEQTWDAAKFKNTLAAVAISDGSTVGS